MVDANRRESGARRRAEPSASVLETGVGVFSRPGVGLALAAGQGNGSGAEDPREGAGGRRMERDGASAGKAANGFPVALRGGDGATRDRRSERIEGGSR